MKSALLLVFVCSTVNGARIPEFFKICARNDPNVNDCLKNNIQSAIQNLGNGIPEFGLRALDPFSKKFVKMEYVNGLFVGRATVEKIDTFGLTKAKVHNVRTNFQGDFVDIEIDLTNEKVNIVGYFHGEIGVEKILLKTQSSINNTLTDLTWTWKIHAEPKMIDGKVHLKVTKFGMRPKVGNMEILLPEIFSENPVLSRFVIDLVQVYWDVIYKELLPGTEKIWNKIGTNACNKIFKNIPYDEIFPLH